MWKTIITELENIGLSQNWIAMHVGLTQGAISQLKNVPGREPSYTVGAKLVDLHKRLVKRVA